MYCLLAEYVPTTMGDFKSGYGGLIFTGLFFLALILVGIWWLKRQV